MLSNVVKDIGSFLLFFAIVIGAFSISIGIVSEKRPKDYNDINYVALYVMALRESIGDFDTFQMIKNSEDKVLAWIIWIFIIIIGNIVFMNFIIAVVNDSYQKCMSKSVASTYLSKLQMIVEYETILGKSVKEKNKKNWFPNYIIKCSLVHNEPLSN
jgi:uncharacterized membrane protein